MNIPRSVVEDLLPLYLGDEISPETRAFVDRHLIDDPELRAELERLRSADPFSSARTPGPPEELALRSLKRTRALLAMQKWLFGIALSATLIGLSFEFQTEDGRLTEWHFLFRESPAVFGTSLLIGIGCWIAYFVTRRR
jgi:anti-sigma factor RsiW